MKSFIHYTLLLCLVTVLSVVTKGVAHAETVGGSGGGLENPLGPDMSTILQFFEALLSNVVIPIGVTVVAFFIIVSGFYFVTAGGSEEKLSKAKAAFTGTIIGAVILLGSWTITQVLQETICQIAPDTESLCQPTTT